MRRLLTLGLALFAAVFTLAALPSAALAVQYTLNYDKCTGGCGTAGTVTLTQSVADVVVNVTLTSGDRFALGGNGFAGAFVFNLAGNPTISVSGLPLGFSLLSRSAGDLKQDAFGNFDYAIVCNTCQGGQVTN